VMRALTTTPEWLPFFPSNRVWDSSQGRHAVASVAAQKALILRDLCPTASKIVLVDDALERDPPPGWLLEAGAPALGGGRRVLGPPLRGLRRGREGPAAAGVLTVPVSGVAGGVSGRHPASPGRRASAARAMALQGPLLEERGRWAPEVDRIYDEGGQVPPGANPPSFRPTPLGLNFTMGPGLRWVRAATVFTLIMWMLVMPIVYTQLTCDPKTLDAHAAKHPMWVWAILLVLSVVVVLAEAKALMYCMRPFKESRTDAGLTEARLGILGIFKVSDTKYILFRLFSTFVNVFFGLYIFGLSMVQSAGDQLCRGTTLWHFAWDATMLQSWFPFISLYFWDKAALRQTYGHTVMRGGVILNLQVTQFYLHRAVMLHTMNTIYPLDPLVKLSLEEPSRHGRFKPTFRSAQTWLNARNWRPRKPKNLRGVTLEQEAIIMTTWVSTLQFTLLQAPVDGAAMSPDDGWRPVQDRHIMDQVGVNFDLFSGATTWVDPEEAEAGAIRVQGSGSGGDKRFGTVHICLGCDLAQPQPKLFIALMLKAGRISARERAAYEGLTNVQVAFQKCAVVDQPLLGQWLENTWKIFRGENPERHALLTFDNLNCQSRLSSRRVLADHKTVGLLGRKGSSTHVWQGIDRGVGKDNKCILCEEQTEGLMSKENFKRWPKLTAWEKQALFAQMASRAHGRCTAHAKYFGHAGLTVSVTQARVDNAKADSSPSCQVPPVDQSKIDELKELVEDPGEAAGDGSGSGEDSGSTDDNADLAPSERADTATVTALLRWAHRKGHRNFMDAAQYLIRAARHKKAAHKLSQKFVLQHSVEEAALAIDPSWSTAHCWTPRLSAALEREAAAQRSAEASSARARAAPDEASVASGSASLLARGMARRRRAAPRCTTAGRAPTGSRSAGGGLAEAEEALRLAQGVVSQLEARLTGLLAPSLGQARVRAGDFQRQCDSLRARLHACAGASEEGTDELRKLSRRDLCEIKQFTKNPPDAIRRTLVAAWLLLNGDRFAGSERVSFDEMHLLWRAGHRPQPCGGMRQVRDWPKCQRMLAQDGFIEKILRFEVQRLDDLPHVVCHVAERFFGMPFQNHRHRGSRGARAAAPDAAAAQHDSA
ncbi:unnamed protein product, partial [Prorocentrum cordatum]